MKSPKPPASDPHFNSKRREILEIWDEMQRLQTDFCFPQELSHYFLSNSWVNASAVVDFGTGNGYYLTRLSDCFPRKQYLGIDSSAELIEIAKRDFRRDNVEYASIGLADVAGTFDFAVLRLLIQHLDDIPTALQQVAKVVKNGGSALVIDAYDPFRAYVPELPEFMDFFSAYTASELASGRDRRFAERFSTSVEASTDWDVINSTTLLIPSTVGDNKTLFAKTYQRLIDLVETAGELTYDFDSVRNALAQWGQDANAYTQVGLRMIELRRV